ncbi:hypothetical protein V6x_54390 [Gimesia chilikensis]|uniref:Uncharacterized protein n=1 Tax=Gimesia chilikensis TaxID=2605989 RepID=A0A517WKB3_9PLAN|nr:hypothetical protein [Gimesia chilikensis]QDU05698.1 hypothetical protein V6x_54390 [Gimesia chilikensis]
MKVKILLRWFDNPPLNGFEPLRSDLGLLHASPTAQYCSRNSFNAGLSFKTKVLSLLFRNGHTELQNHDVLSQNNLSELRQEQRTRSDDPCLRLIILLTVSGHTFLNGIALSFVVSSTLGVV